MDQFPISDETNEFIESARVLAEPYEARIAELKSIITQVRARLEYMSQPTMGLPSGADARDFAMYGATEHAARYALQLCIDNARDAKKIIDDAGLGQPYGS